MKQRNIDSIALSSEEEQLCAVMRAVCTGIPCKEYIGSEESYKRFFGLCRQQKVEALAYMCIKNQPSFAKLSQDGKKAWQSAFVTVAAIQRRKTAHFLELAAELPQDINWFVVKGIALRSIYPVAELRPSGDEDIYVEKKDYDRLVDFVKTRGMEICHQDKRQTVLRDKVSLLTLEIKVADEETLKARTEFFVDGQRLYTLLPTHHGAYLIKHAAKHFCHCGLGIRMLTDIGIYIRENCQDIDADLLFDMLKQRKTDIFAANMLCLCEETLGIVFPEKISEKLRDYNPDTALLLKDMMGGGIYGTATESRKLAGRITTMTVERVSFIGALFPSVSHMKERYHILEKCIILLPFVYIYRLVAYFFRTVFARNNNEDSGISLGLERLVLVKKYGLSEK